MAIDPNDTSSINVPRRVMAVLENSTVQKTMHWEMDGKSFRITKPDLFAKTVLVDHFKGVKFGSFVKSLQQWGFKMSGLKINGRYVHYTFSHELFRSDQPELCCSMKRVSVKEWKASRSIPKHRGAEPETKITEQPINDPQSLQTNFALPMQSFQPLFVPQPVFFPPLGMQQFFMANQYPTFPVIAETNPPTQGTSNQASIKPPVTKKVPRKKIRASKPQPQLTPRISPKPKEPRYQPKIYDVDENSRVRLTRDELSAIVGIAMLDSANC